MQTDLSYGILEEILIQLDVLSSLLDADVTALLERTPADVGRRGQRRVRQIGEDGPFHMQRNAAR